MIARKASLGNFYNLQTSKMTAKAMVGVDRTIIHTQKPYWVKQILCDHSCNLSKLFCTKFIYHALCLSIELAVVNEDTIYRCIYKKHIGEKCNLDCGSNAASSRLRVVTVLCPVGHFIFC